ncbi:unnamed protein product [Coregonus sp. 'balchen']|nr:unnamed protein product [Coregonus sp. 'balchen']
MSASIKSSPSPPVLPKPEGRRIKSSHSLVSPVEDHDRALKELPELKEKQVSVTDRSKMQLVPMQNDLIPDELLATLTSTICPHDRLGLPKLTKTPKDFKVHGIRHTDAVWHHPVGRKKYKYFLDQPTSLTGAGRKFTVLLEDNERMLKVFPSMQLKGFHTETLAQRALDRRLTEEIICFRSAITKLNTELCKMREHDGYVSTQAERAQEELAKALEQSQKNSDIVGEYHDLYEMQRRRLEGQVARLTDERDLWSRVTYNLALKLASRLHVSEQTWTKTAEHFTVFLTSKDTEDLNHIMQLTEQWKEQLTSFVQSLREAEHGQCEGIRSIQADIVLTIQCERYGGEDLLSCQETLNMLGQLQEAWEEVGRRLFRRHPAPDGEPPRGQEAMRELCLAVSELHKQLGTRINGESGIHKQLMCLVGVMEFWATRLKALVGRTERLPHCDWLKLEKALGSWMLLAEEALQHAHSTQPENERFILTQANFFDCENRRLCEEMVPDHCDDQEQDALPGLNSTAIMEMNRPAVVPLEALDEEEEQNKKTPMEFIEVIHIVEAEDPEEAGSIMKLIGHDGNIIEQTLGEDTIQLDGTEVMVARPYTPNGQRAFDALATVGVLQHELLGVEARVHRAEERALKAEEALQAALEKIQDLERQLQGRTSLEAKVSKQSVAASPKSKVSSPEPKPVSQKPEPSLKQTKPKKR